MPNDTLDEIEARVAAAVEEERERCAKVCDERSQWAAIKITETDTAQFATYSMACDDCAEVIRAAATRPAPKGAAPTGEIPGCEDWEAQFVAEGRCSTPSQEDAGPVSGEKLWLWKNGDHYLAFAHEYPTYGGGDPMVLGEPFGYAILVPSEPRRTAPPNATRGPGSASNTEAPPESLPVCHKARPGSGSDIPADGATARPTSPPSVSSDSDVAPDRGINRGSSSPTQTVAAPWPTAVGDKSEINRRVQARYAGLMHEGKHGHYETMFNIVHREREAARAELLAQIEEPSEAMLQVGEQQQEHGIIAGRELAKKIWRAMSAALADKLQYRARRRIQLDRVFHQDGERHGILQGARAMMRCLRSPIQAATAAFFVAWATLAPAVAQEVHYSPPAFNFPAQFLRANPPTSFGNWNSITTAFTGDLSATVAIGKTLSGTSVGTTGAPATGYSYHQETANLASYLSNASGNNQSTSSNDGRTAAFNFYGKTDQFGQGDAVTWWCDQLVASTRAGATSWLASPAASCLAGATYGAVNGGYLQGTGDINLVDNGFDMAGFSDTRNLNRSNATGNINTNWVGSYYASIGTKPIDAFQHVGGPTRFGLDLTATTYPDVSLAGIAIVSGGTGYTVGDVVTAAGGSVDQATKFKVTAAPAGVVTGLAIERAGLYTVAPTSPNAATGGTGTGLSLTLQYNSATAAPSLVTKANQCWYGNATPDPGAYSTGLPSTTYLGASYLCYSSALGAWLMVAEGSIVGEFFSGATGVIIPQSLQAKIKNNPKTTNYSIGASDFGQHFDNAGAAGTVVFSLPDAGTGGLNYCFLVMTAQSLQIKANGTDQILFGTSASTLGGTQTASTVGSSVCVESHGAGRWFSRGHEGTWTAA